MFETDKPTLERALAELIKSYLDENEGRIVQSISVRIPVEGKQTHVNCLLFAESGEALKTIGNRIASPTIQERAFRLPQHAWEKENGD